MKISFTWILLFASCLAFGQTAVTGTVKDVVTGETLPGATVIYSETQGGATDLDGKFEFKLAPGTYTFVVNFVNYKSFKQEVVVGTTPVEVVFELESDMMQEVEIIGDIAIDRKTPVAVSNISGKKIKEELGTQDLPMILNSTPGIYATQGGGGDGDSRVNIRGFNNRFVAVMVDGIPMNDMENGTVYWSNWFGLDVVTQKMQVQRGLGASKLAIPSIGGTINILSEGIEDKQKVVLSTEYGNNTNARLTLGYNSGRLPGGWGVTGALSAKYNDGWVEHLISRQLFYFIKIQKQFVEHSFSFTAMGS
ncbi:MAG: TonB-dependent receptor, partial [Flavobacteriales bacterium]